MRDSGEQFYSWESFIISLDILNRHRGKPHHWLRIFHYQPWYTYRRARWDVRYVENLSLSALIYLVWRHVQPLEGWESFIISLDILIARMDEARIMLRIFHYQPWYTYVLRGLAALVVENLSLSALIYLRSSRSSGISSWESFIISLDILSLAGKVFGVSLRIFHYQPWYTYICPSPQPLTVENLSLSALIYLHQTCRSNDASWESFIISLDILNGARGFTPVELRIFHYQPWYTYWMAPPWWRRVENLSLSALIYLPGVIIFPTAGWESFIISLDILNPRQWWKALRLRIFHYQPWYTYRRLHLRHRLVENLSLSALIYLPRYRAVYEGCWESFIISLDILTR